MAEEQTTFKDNIYKRIQEGMDGLVTKPTTLTLTSGFSYFFTSAVSAAMAPWLYYVMAAIVVGEGLLAIRNSLDLYSKKHPFLRVAWLASEMVLAAAAIGVVTVGFLVGIAPVAVVAPGFFVGIMLTKAGFNFKFGLEERKQAHEIRDFLKANQNPTDLDDTEKRKTILGHLVGKDLQEAYIKLKELQALGVDFSEKTLASFFMNPDILKQITIALEITSEEAEKITVNQAIILLVPKINACACQYGATMDVVNENGNYNDHFFQANTVKSTLAIAQDTHRNQKLGYFGLSLAFATGVLAIAFDLGATYSSLNALVVSSASLTAGVGFAATAAVLGGKFYGNFLREKVRSFGDFVGEKVRSLWKKPEKTEEHDVENEFLLSREGSITSRASSIDSTSGTLDQLNQAGSGSQFNKNPLPPDDSVKNPIHESNDNVSQGNNVSDRLSQGAQEYINNVGIVGNSNTSKREHSNDAETSEDETAPLIPHQGSNS